MKRALGIFCDILVVAVGLIIVWNFLAHRRLSIPGFSKEEPKIGSRLNDVDINWNLSERSIVLLLSNSCPYCEQSSPFYRHLLSVAGSRVQVVALFPQSADAARAYLAAHDLKISNVRAPARVPWELRTPTVLLCDRGGKILKSWIGRQQPKGEEEILAATSPSSAALQPKSPPIRHSTYLALSSITSER